MDIHLVRLQYELLNTPLETLAESSGATLASLEFEAKRSGWTQKWPELPSINRAHHSKSSSGQSLEQELLSEGVSIDDEIENLITTNQKRLRAFTIAKDLYLAARYAQLENDIILRIVDVVSECTTVESLKFASSAYKNLIDSTNIQALQKQSNKFEDTGIPVFTIRDMSGSGIGSGSADAV